MFLYLISASFCQGGFIVVANNNFPFSSLTTTQVKRIYLKKISHIHGVKILPLNLLARDGLRKNFENHILSMSNRRIQEYWMTRHFHGERPALVKHSQKSIIGFLLKIDGSIAYISEINFTKGLKVLYRKSEHNNSTEALNTDISLHDRSKI